MHIVSDIHMEFLGRTAKPFLDSLPGGPLLIVAGDLQPVRYLNETMSTVRHLLARYEDVVFVPGNHAYYRSSPGKVAFILEACEKRHKRFHWLRTGRTATINGQRFVGDTMWFPDHPWAPIYRRELNDFTQIQDFEPWVYEENARFRHWLNQNLTADDIVVTHHLPSHASVPERYRSSPVDTIFYVSDMLPLILERQPKLWVHGHTHTRHDYTIYNTRVFCNPKGYPHELLPFDPARQPGTEIA